MQSAKMLLSYRTLAALSVHVTAFHGGATFSSVEEADVIPCKSGQWVADYCGTPYLHCFLSGIVWFTNCSFENLG